MSVSCLCVDKLLFGSGAILEKLPHVGMVFEVLPSLNRYSDGLGGIYIWMVVPS